MHALLLLPLVATLPLAQVPAPTPYRSAMPEFWRFVEAAQDAPDEQIPALFRQHMVSAHPELYVSGVLGDPKKDPPRWEGLIRDYWHKLKPLLPQVRAAEQDLGAAMSEAEGLFSRQFPGFKLEIQVLIVPSRLDWDGTVKRVSEKPAMLFAPDGIAAIHGQKFRERLRPLVIHELFHTHHEFDEPDPDFFTMLWREGLASYVSHALLPKASLEDVLLSTELAHLSPAQEARLAREALARLERRDAEARGPFFNYALAPLAPGIPPRAGYLLGYRVAQRLSKTQSLDALAQLKRPELEPLIRHALKELASAH